MLALSAAHALNGLYPSAVGVGAFLEAVSSHVANGVVL